jgi:hypothetical protein
MFPLQQPVPEWSLWSCQNGPFAHCHQHPRKNVASAIGILDGALALHTSIQQSNVFLADRTNTYQANWKLALEDLLKDNRADFDFLALMS